ncbi:hypothetical protein [Nocardia sp. NPDC004604]|uniref:hypothetical protein n=1 Tax=Nocardia sp. NPDC004604 TaxID=3157013 RepID=UPI0033B4E8CC
MTERRTDNHALIDRRKRHGANRSIAMWLTAAAAGFGLFQLSVLLIGLLPLDPDVNCSAT